MHVQLIYYLRYDVWNVYAIYKLSIVFHSRVDSLNVYAMCTRLSVFSEGYRTGHTGGAGEYEREPERLTF